MLAAMTISVSCPEGSAQFIRFQGTLDTDAAPSYGQIPAPFAAGTYVVRFLLGLAPTYVQPPGSTGPLDTLYRPPLTTFNNAGSGGNAPVTLKDSVWAQNTQVIVKALDANLTACELDPVEWELDPATNLAVLVLSMTVDNGPPEVDIQVEIKHSMVR